MENYKRKLHLLEKISSLVSAILIFVLTIYLTFPYVIFSQEGNENEARLIYDQAVKLAKEKKWESALELFIKAAEKGAPAVVHYNIARCYESLGKFEEAVKNYKKYLESEITQEERKTVEEKIKFLFEKPSLLSINTNPQGATVEEKEKGILGITPLQTTLSAGSHKILIQKAGFGEKFLNINAGYGKEIKFNITLEEKTTSKNVNGASENEISEKKEVTRPGGKKRNIGLVFAIGGGASIYTFIDYPSQVGGDFSFNIHKILGSKNLRWGAGIELLSSTYQMEDSSGSDWLFMFINTVAYAQIRYKLHKRLELLGAIGAGFSVLASVENVPANREMKLLGGKIEGGGFPFFTPDIELTLRINLISGLHLLFRPSHLFILVPLREVYGNSKVFPIYQMELMIGWEI